MPRQASPPFEDFTERPYPLNPRGIACAARESGALAYTAPPLLFLFYTLYYVWADGPWWRGVLATLLAIVFAVLFVVSTGIRAYPLPDRVRWLAASWVVTGLFTLLIGPAVLFLVMFLEMLHGILLPQRWARPAVALIAAVGIVGGLVWDRPIASILAAIGLAIALGVGSAIEREILKERLETAEQRNAVLAVAAERERIGRDLHDILGHSLTTITVSAQLARRLVEADPAAAADQIAEIERISRQSLADVRATASGMQQVRVASEVASARSVLAAAGIEARVPAALPALEEDRAELFGYVVREGVTNVVRHSRATTCTITVGPDAVEVRDDGMGIPAGRARTGLDGLTARVAEAGGELRVDPGGGEDPARPGTRLTASIPPGGTP